MAEGASSFWWKCVDLNCGGGNCSASYVAVFLFSIMIMVFFDNMVMVVWLPSMWLNYGGGRVERAACRRYAIMVATKCINKWGGDAICFIFSVIFLKIGGRIWWLDKIGLYL